MARRPSRWAEAAVALGTSTAIALHGIVVLAMPPAAAGRGAELAGASLAMPKRPGVEWQDAALAASVVSVAVPGGVAELAVEYLGAVAMLAPREISNPLPLVQVAGLIDTAALAALQHQAERLETLRRKIHFQAHTPDACLPPRLAGVLYDVAEKFGPVRIASTHRDPARNRRVGGKPKSFHLQCRAIDFFVDGNNKGLVDYLKARAEVGGYKRYRQGFFHIDDGPRRTW